jgi:hypothetical protein
MNKVGRFGLSDRTSGAAFTARSGGGVWARRATVSSRQATTKRKGRRETINEGVKQSGPAAPGSTGGTVLTVIR